MNISVIFLKTIFKSSVTNIPDIPDVPNLNVGIPPADFTRTSTSSHFPTQKATNFSN